MKIQTFVHMMRRILGVLARDEVKLGPYAASLGQVQDGATFPVKVAGYPDASTTMYYPAHVDEPLPLVLYIHGGGWSWGSAQGVSSFAKVLSSNGYAVANVEYALGPEHPHPAQIAQLMAVLDHLVVHAPQLCIDSSRIFIGGNSAGAHLSALMGSVLSSRELADELGISPTVSAEAVRGLLLFNGVYDFSTVGECKFPFLDKLVRSYTGREDFQHYERLDQVSPARHVGSEYPSVFITVGDADPLASQTLEFIDVLEAADIECASLLWDSTHKLGHDYIYRLDTEEGRSAYLASLAFMQSRDSFPEDRLACQ